MNLFAKIKKYEADHENKCFALGKWLSSNGKKFGFKSVILFLFQYAKGDEDVVSEIIDQLSEKEKTFGRTQVYSDRIADKPDIVIENGELVLKNYKPGKKLVKKSMKLHTNNKIFRKSDDQVSKTYQNMEAKVMDLGVEVRKMYPSADKQFILMAMKAIKVFAAKKKINQKRVVEMLKKHKLAIDDSDFSIKVVSNESRIIRIDTNMYNLLKEEVEMTEYRFNSNVKTFLKQLLDDPVNAKPSELLCLYGFNRSKLLRELSNVGIIERDDRISDKDENGEMKTATMMVKFRIPKKDFKHKLKKLYIKLFEKNVPDRKINEDGEGACSADSSGQFSQPVFPMMRRKMYGVDESTDTCSVGNYEYDVPFGGDKETLSRKNGKYGSVSIPKQ